MPVNIQQGNAVQFVVEFLSSTTGNISSPTSASITVTYNVSGTATSSTLTLSHTGSFWTATWASSVADLGDVAWTTISSDNASTAASGTIRLIERML